MERDLKNKFWESKEEGDSIMMPSSASETKLFTSKTITELIPAELE